MDNFDILKKATSAKEKFNPVDISDRIGLHYTLGFFRLSTEAGASHLLQHVQRYRVEHVVNDDSQHRTGGSSERFLHV